VEWIADHPVNEPLIESVMKDLSGNLGLAFLSHGKVIREIQKQNSIPESGTEPPHHSLARRI
jgi:hypothetical protein